MPEWRMYVDMDGVLADFDSHYEALFGARPSKLLDNADWDKVREADDFYLNIPPMPDMRELWDFVSRFRPTVLTGIPWSVPEAASNKRAWVREHLGDEVPMIACASKEKCLYAHPGDILIDDWEKYRSLWEGKGGRWITHVSAERTIEQLRSMGIG